MRIGQLNALTLFAIGWLIGWPQSLSAQMTKEALLKHLATPFAPTPQEWKELDFSQALDLTQTLVMEGSLDKPQRLLDLMTRKALNSSKQDQQAYLETLFNPILLAAPDLNYSVWKACSKFPKSAYSTNTKVHIRKYLLTQPQYLEKWLLLAGFAIDDPMLILQVLEGQKSASIQQAGKLALVRMGDEIKTKAFLKAIKRIPIQDQFVYDIAPLAIYTRNRKVIQYLVDIIVENLGNCYPADAEIGGQISCGYRLVELLGPILQDFPQEIKEEFSNADAKEQLSAARRWLRANRKRLRINREYL